MGFGLSHRIQQYLLDGIKSWMMSEGYREPWSMPLSYLRVRGSINVASHDDPGDANTNLEVARAAHFAMYMSCQQLALCTRSQRDLPNSRGDKMVDRARDRSL